MTIAVFGAAFDPPHNGHLYVVKSLLESKLADQIWLLPALQHTFAKNMSATADRLAMLQALVLDDRVRIEHYELEHVEPSITYRTMCALRQKYPQHRLVFVIGDDNVARFKEWDDYEKLLAEFPVWVFPRQGLVAANLLPKMQLLPHFSPVDVSSTQVRQLLKAGQSVTDLVPSAVAEYISQHRLYRGNEAP